MKKIKIICFSIIVIMLILACVMSVNLLNNVNLVGKKILENKMEALTTYENKDTVYISASQKPWANVFCEQEGYDINTWGTYTRTNSTVSLSNIQKFKIAYILTTNSEGYTKRGSNDVPSGFSGDGPYASFNNAQQAIWATLCSKGFSTTHESYGVNLYYRKVEKIGSTWKWQGGTHSPSTSTSRPTWVNLYINASDYATAANSASISATTYTGTVKKVTDDGKVVIGPYKVSYTTITGRTATVSLDSSLSGKAYVSDINGNNKSIVNNTDFYITVNQAHISSLTGKSIKINYKINLQIVDKAYKFSPNTGTQQLITFTLKSYDKTANVNLSIPTLVPKVAINLNKINDLGNNLTGAKFDISFKQGATSLGSKTGVNAGETLTSNQPSGTGDITVTVKETNVPEGYYSFGTATATLKYDATNSKWYLYDNGNTIFHEKSNTRTTTLTTLTINTVNKAKIENLVINKVNSIGIGIEGAKFKVTDITNCSNSTDIKSKTYITDANGNINIGEIKVGDLNNSQVVITLEETDAPAGYNKLTGNVEITLTYLKALNNWVSEITSKPTIEQNAQDALFTTNCVKSGNKTTVNVKIPDLAKIDELKIKKVDQNGTSIKGAKFKVTNITNCSNSTDIEGTEYVTGADGILTIKDVVSKSMDESIVVELEETNAPKGYKKLSETIEVTFTYNGTSKKWEGIVTKEPTVEHNNGCQFDVTSTGSTNQTIATITATDLAEIDDLIINKIDSMDNSLEISGVKFKVTGTTNCANSEDILNKEFKTVDGKLSFGRITFANINETLEITIEETSAALGYKNLTAPITIKIDYNGAASYNVSIESDNEEDVTIEDNSNNIITVAVPNIPVMLVGGIVFNDGSNGESKEGNQTLQNGTYTKQADFDEGLSGVTVQLLNEDSEVIATTISSEGNETITYTSYNGEEYTKTLVKGEYFFSCTDEEDYLVRDNYTVIFIYNGQKFITTAIAANLQENNDMNKTEEMGRSTFNNQFVTINNASGLAYSYTEKEDCENVEDANLLMYTDETTSWVNDNYESEVKEEFTIYSKTGYDLTDNWQNVWNSNGEVNTNAYQLDTNCGLRERRLDISLTDDVENVEVSINGKTATYNYAQVIDGEVDALLNGDNLSKNVKLNYNQDIYESDYNYRIEDYADGLLENNLNENDAAEIAGNVSVESELKINVTYKLKVKLQTITEEGSVRVKTVYDYYNKDVYTYIGEDERVSVVEPGVVEIDLSDSELNGEYSEEIELKFSVVIPDGANVGEEICTGENYAEIVEYSTEDGLIDRDSNPGDISEHIEDDTDYAPSMIFKLAENKTRTISGYVWNDSANKDSYEIGDGIKKEETEEVVNDVIVQLIEIKPIEILGTTYNLEYIWQETRSGSNEVSAIDLGNTNIENYYNNITENGKYEFTGFIPGNYIVRFIYGDGTTEDVTTYNGQDYKSTYYGDYASNDYYNTSENSFNKDISVARDNEARRLEVMAYSAEIDYDIGSAVESKTDPMLKATWMCAETLKINVPVDADDIATASDSTDSSNSENQITFDKINFGLEKRPETKIELEKHITALSVTTESGQILLDARADIDDLTKNKEGVTKGLTSITSTRNNRGYWRLETDLSELGQGSEMEVTYTYVVKNVGDTDYLSKTLIDEYKADITDPSKTINNYKEYLIGTASYVKANIQIGSHTIGKYLGNFYYTGSQDPEKDAKVPTQVNEIQEALNNQFGLSTDNNYFEKVTEADDGNSQYAISSGGKYQRTIWRITGDVIESKKETMNTIIKSTGGLSLIPGGKDLTKSVNLEATITTDGGSYDSYIAEITKYTNAAGRVDMNVVPENLSYVHSDDTTRTLDNTGDTGKKYKSEVSNEHDEFWGESIIISKPTGEDKITPIQIIMVSTFAVAIIGLGAITIKKFVLKK